MANFRVEPNETSWTVEVLNCSGGFVLPVSAPRPQRAGVCYKRGGERAAVKGHASRPGDRAGSAASQRTATVARSLQNKRESLRPPPYMREPEPSSGVVLML